MKLLKISFLSLFLLASCKGGTLPSLEDRNLYFEELALSELSDTFKSQNDSLLKNTFDYSNITQLTKTTTIYDEDDVKLLEQVLYYDTDNASNFSFYAKTVLNDGNLSKELTKVCILNPSSKLSHCKVQTQYFTDGQYYLKTTVLTSSIVNYSHFTNNYKPLVNWNIGVTTIPLLSQIKSIGERDNQVIFELKNFRYFVNKDEASISKIINLSNSNVAVTVPNNVGANNTENVNVGNKAEYTLDFTSTIDTKTIYDGITNPGK